MNSSEPATADRDADIRVGPLERMNLLAILKDMTVRLDSLEKALTGPRASDTRSFGKFALEFSKVLFGGWPALGFLFLLLFYSPLNQALSSIPEKVRSADEIKVGTVSLTSKIKAAAATAGLGKLSETIPKLSPGALARLLTATESSRSLISYTPSDDNRHINTLYVPSDEETGEITELQTRGLIALRGGIGNTDEAIKDGELASFLQNLRKRYPGSVDGTSTDGRVVWALKPPAPKEDSVHLMWQLTDSGKQAVNLILKTVSEELIQGGH